MDGTPVHIDEFGTVRFVVFSDSGASYEFEQEADSVLLFITLRDERGRAVLKKIVNTSKTNNQEIVESYKSYIREQDEAGKGDYRGFH